MSPCKPANPVRNYAVGSAIAALILLGPVAALLMVAAAEMLIDLLIVGGTSAVCAVAAGGIGLVLSRKFWQGHKVAHQSEPELVPGDTSIAAAPIDVATASWSPFVTWTNADARLVWVRPGRLGAP